MPEDKPLTTEDLYGTSTDQADIAMPQAAPQKQVQPLVYEETPEILPIEETPAVQSAPPPVSGPRSPAGPHRQPSGCAGTFGLILIFAALFVLGVFLSSAIRQYLPGNTQGAATTQQPAPTGAPESSRSAAVVTPAGSNTSWKTYSVISGVTKQPVPGVQFQLPSGVLAPICDGGNCASQGTYLPGGTRLTVAPRGAGQLLGDYRGSAISDSRGTTFTTKQTTVAGRPAMDFVGDFSGGTTTGFSFTKMHGVMIAVSDTASLEVNHFAPVGITTDFAGDDQLFSSVLEKITITGNVPPSAAITPSVMPSGY